MTMLGSSAVMFREFTEIRVVQDSTFALLLNSAKAIFSSNVI